MAKLVAATALAVVFAGLAGWRLLPKLRSAHPAAVAAPIAPTSPAAITEAPSTTASVAGPDIASAAPPPTAIASAALPSAAPQVSPPPQPTKPFDARGARAALDALSPTLIDCKIPSGRKGRIRVAFSKDGTVSSAKVLAPFAGTPGGACVAAHLGEAKVAPFVGSAPAYNYGFTIPRH
jgi:hypothetical protein